MSSDRTHAQIAYDSEARGNRDIYVMDSDGQNPRNLTNHPANDWHPSWSPSGARLAFTSNRDGTFGIYVMDANGENVRNLTRHPLGTTFRHGHLSVTRLRLEP